MEILFVSILFILGLIIIIKGGDLFVDAAIWIARVTGIPSILIGATIVSLATTLPEFFVSTIATLKGYPEVAVGNALGSSICNIGFILGLGALISPIPVRRKFFSIKGFIMILSLICFYILAYDKVVTRTEGLLLLGFLSVYILTNILEIRSSSSMSNDYASVKNEKTLPNIIKFILGTGLIVLGARLLVDNGVQIAGYLNIPKQIVSLTLIALGTSLPELVTSIVSIRKGHQGISVGNIIGANIINITMVLGTSAVISTQGLPIKAENFQILNYVFSNVPQTLVLDIPTSFLLMCILVVAGSGRRKIGRGQGFLLLLLYTLYLGILSLIAF